MLDKVAFSPLMYRWFAASAMCIVSFLVIYRHRNVLKILLSPQVQVFNREIFDTKQIILKETTIVF